MANQTILFKRRIPGSGPPTPGTALQAGEPAVAISAAGVSELYIGDGAAVRTLVSDQRQVELAGDQTITGEKTIDIANLKITGGDDGDFITTDGNGDLEWARPIASGATAPTNPIDGDLWYDTDNNLLMVFNGTDWDRVGGGVHSGTTAPTNPSDGDLWFDSSDGELKVWDETGSDWVLVGANYLPLAGGTLTGALTLAADPSVNLGAATKQYVDTHSPIAPFSATKTYAAGDFIIHNGNLYRALAANGPGAFDPDDWDQFQTSAGGTNVITGGTQPSTPRDGELWWDTTNEKLMVYDGTNWVPSVLGLDELEIEAPLAGDGKTTGTALGVTMATTAQINTGTDDVYPVDSVGLRTQTGAAVSTLKTTDKTIVPAINELYDQVGAISGAIRLVGVYDADQDDVDPAAGSGAVAGPLPAAAPANEGWYVIVDVAGDGIGNAPPVALHAGDWLVSNGSTWVHIPLNIAHMAASNVSVSAIDSQPWTNVQAALKGLFDAQGAYAPVHIGGTAPTTPTPIAGDLWFNTTTGRLMVHDGTTWVTAETGLDDLEIEAPLKGDGLTAGTALGVTMATTAQINTGTDDTYPIDSAGLRTQLGAAVSTLETSAKTIVPAINELEDRITAVTGALIFAGTYDVAADEMSPSRPGLDQDDPLPPASNANEGYYFIATTDGTGTGNAPHVPIAIGDWIVSNGAEWIHVPLHHVAVTAANVGITTVDSQPWTNVQTALAGLLNLIVAGGSTAVVADDVSITGDGTTGDPLTVAVIDGGTF